MNKSDFRVGPIRRAGFRRKCSVKDTTGNRNRAHGGGNALEASYKFICPRCSSRARETRWGGEARGE